MFFKALAHGPEIVAQDVEQVLNAVSRPLPAGGFKLRGGLGKTAGADIRRRAFDGVGGRRCGAEIPAAKLGRERFEQFFRRAAESVYNLPSPVNAGGRDETVDLIGLKVSGSVGRNRIQTPSPRRWRIEVACQRFCCANLNNIC